MDTGAQDTSLLQWIINGVIGLLVVSFGWLNFRITRAEDTSRDDLKTLLEDNDEDHNRMRDETRSNAKIMYDDMKGNFTAFDAFRSYVYGAMGNVVTKEDLRDVKRELLEAIRTKA